MLTADFTIDDAKNKISRFSDMFKAIIKSDSAADKQ